MDTIDLDFIGAPAFALRVVGNDFLYAGMNRRLEELTGLDARQLEGKTPRSVFPGETADTVVARYRDCVRSREAVEYEVFHHLPGGNRWWAVTMTPVIDRTSGAVTMLLGIAVDVTPRRNAEIANQEANARLALAMDVIDGGFWHLDVPTGEFRTSKPLASLVAGPKSPELDLDEYVSYVVAEDLVAADLSALKAGLKDESVAEYRVKTFAGELRWLRCQRKLIRDAHRRPLRIVGVAIDVTDQKMVQARYKHQASTDMLTGLANRRSLELRAAELVADRRGTGRGFGLILLDLDGFKPVNDHFGHAAGDALLKGIAERLREVMRDEDVVARFGGDEFAILLEDVEDEAALWRTGDRVAQVVARPLQVLGQTVRVGASFGTAVYGPGDAGFDEVMTRADAAMYRAKAGVHALRPQSRRAGRA